MIRVPHPNCSMLLLTRQMLPVKWGGQLIAHTLTVRLSLLQPFLSKLLTVDLPNLMVLPKRLEINIPPAVTAVAEAAVGHDAVMRAVASAVLQVIVAHQGSHTLCNGDYTGVGVGVSAACMPSTYLHMACLLPVTLHAFSHLD